MQISFFNTPNAPQLSPQQEALITRFCECVDATTVAFCAAAAEVGVKADVGGAVIISAMIRQIAMTHDRMGAAGVASSRHELISTIRKGIDVNLDIIRSREQARKQ